MREARAVAAIAAALVAVLSYAAGQTGGMTVPPDREALEEGQGAGMAIYAELNNYPGPKHVLELQEQLGLSEEQLKQMESIMDAMKENARAKGEQIIREEEMLNSMFASGKASERAVRDLAAEIGRLRGELRGIHLAAHLETVEILSREQTERYMKLRHPEEATPAHGHNGK